MAIYMRIIVLFCCLLRLFPQNGAKSELDEKIEQLMTDFSVPGLQLAVMKNDSIVFYGSSGLLNAIQR